jgi:hypothetical protein
LLIDSNQSIVAFALARSGESMTAKIIYLVTRNASSTRAEFRENWKGHSALGATYPSLRRHFDCIVQCGVEAGGRAGNDDSRFDGANLLSLRNLVSGVEVYEDESQPAMREDELRVFSGYVADSSLIVDETILGDGPRTSVVALQFVKRDAGAEMARFILEWSSYFASEVMSTAAFQSLVRRYVHNHVVLPSRAGFDWDGVAEMWFDTLADARLLLGNPDHLHLVEQEHNWSAPAEMLLVCTINSTWDRETST